MKRSFKAILATLLVLIFSLSAVSVSAGEGGDIIVLYTNDVHCAIDGYSSLAAYREQLIAEGNTVITVDLGDAIQGEIIGTLTNGEAAVELMNATGYDYAIPGNHEFDYGMDNFLGLAVNSADYEYLSANFVDLRLGTTVLPAYAIENFGGFKVAFVGVSTPEAYTKSTPVYFQDEDGNYIYSFSENSFYDTVQTAVDRAIYDGADLVVAMCHLGIEGTTDGWKSTDLIANTTGIDVVLDGHSHQTIHGDIYQNKNGDSVLLSSTGEKFANIGKLTVSAGGGVISQLVSLDAVTGEGEAYNDVQTLIDNYNAELAYLFNPVGISDANLAIYDEEGTRIIRNCETNMGDFVTDAYRAVTGADIAFANGGGIRAEIPAGSVSRKQIMDVNPWSNEMCVIEATGQQILDALEHGASAYPQEFGGFLQVSGLSYEIHSYIESPVRIDEMGAFMYVEEGAERRVANVKVGDEAIDPAETYTVAGSFYMLKNGGDGFTMFDDCSIVAYEGLLCDAEMLIEYFLTELGGQISAEQYGNLYGEGRITLFTELVYTLGDINDDGLINSLDAAQILRFDAELISLAGASLAAADVNGDGTVNSLDASLILKYDASLITEF
ncbi:MAG: 5'-nucleotidase C-terminal domain-containing protein [Clostridia bacterium]|nr:5'-nucleotidase C-terminal domain-containing protein [Clostridia bacterium]